MVVQHNLTAMNSNRLLGLTTSAQAKSTEKLSSGYKINRAADDAAGLSISEKMRRQIRGLSQASLNAQDGISAAQTAEGALAEVHDMLQRMNELAVKAANGTDSENDRENIQDEISELKIEIDRIAETTKFNETYLLKGNAAADKVQQLKYSTTPLVEASATIKDGVTLYQADGTGISTGEDLTAYLESGGKVYTEAPKTATQATASNYTYVKAAYESGGSDHTGSFYAKDSNLDLNEAENAEVLADALKNKTKLYKESASGSQDTEVTVKSNTNTVTYSGDLYDANGNTLANADVLDALNRGGTVYKTQATAGTQATEGTDYTYTKSALPALYDSNGDKIAANGLEQYFNVAEDGTVFIKDGRSVYTDEKATAKLDSDHIGDYVGSAKDGIAELKVSLHVGADSNENNQITLKIKSMSTAAIGIDKVTVAGEDNINARSAIDTIKCAIQRVSAQRSALGAVQNRLEHTITNLDNVVENTTAAESQIRDTDMATEMVKYSNNNILAQAGQAMLAQANQSNQGVLSLLQ